MCIKLKTHKNLQESDALIKKGKGTEQIQDFKHQLL